jgi:uncharacterized protein YjaG (DUF416 family)
VTSVALNETKSLLTRLDGQRRTTFACLTAERMLANYRVFESETGWGDVRVLRRALDLAWRSAHGERVEKAALDSAYETVGAQAPETEDFDSSFCSAALDAAEAICGVLECVRGDSLSGALRAAQAAYDTVEMFTRDEAELVPIREPSLVKRELKHQLESLVELKNLRELSTSAVERLRFKYAGASLDEKA